MAEKPSRPPPRPPKDSAQADWEDRYPTREELLADLTTYGSKRPPPVEERLVSRRTRDFLLVAGLGSAAIVALLLKVMSSADAGSTARLAFTAVALYCGMLWYIFYGVISRY